jgi:hypothetical protein
VSVFGVDYAWGRPGIPALNRAGVKFVCRYLSHDTSGKNLDRGEAEQLSAAGIWIIVIWETTASRALAGRAAGVADATAAQKQAKALGQPAGRPIYFAVDFDADAGQQDEIHAYLDGAASVLGRDRIGLYAGYGPIKRAFDAGKITYGWQTYAWSGGRWDTRAQLQQYSNDQKINGVGVDFDRALAADYGQWRIGATPSEDEPLKIVINLGSSKPLTVPAGKRASISFDKEYSDPDGIHKDGNFPDWLPETAAFYIATLTLVADGQADDEKLKMMISEYERDSDTRVRDLVGEDKVGNGSRVEYALSGIVWFSDKSKYRADVTNYGTAPITIVSAGLKVAR